jgi:hypothetical protein
VTRSLHDALEETLGFIHRIRAGEGAETELHNVRAYLLSILELVECDPGIEAASDDLYPVAKELAGGPDRGPRMSRLLHEAFLRFGDRLASARPSDQAQKMPLVHVRLAKAGDVGALKASEMHALEVTLQDAIQFRAGDIKLSGKVPR